MKFFERVPKTDEELKALANREIKYLFIITVALVLFEAVYLQYGKKIPTKFKLQRDTTTVPSNNIRPHNTDRIVRYTNNSTKASVLTDKEFDATRKVEFTYYEVVKLLIKSIEDYKPTTYYCAANHKTIGWGITPEELETLNREMKYNPRIEWSDLKNNIRNNEIVLKDLVDLRFNKLKARLPYLDSPALCAMVSLSYNAGEHIDNFPAIKHGLKKYRETRGKNRTALANAFRKFVWAETKPGVLEKLKGLERRRSMEVKLLTEDISMKTFKELKSIVAKQYKDAKA